VSLGGLRISNDAESATVLTLQRDVTQVWRALDEVLQSAPFRSSRQCQALLRYVVEHSLNGEADLLRERVIGAEVFSRGPDYEPGDDPIVRVRAAEVRKRLAQYYQSRPESPVRIEVPPGSYKAVFHWSPTEASSAVEVKAPPGTSRWRWIVSLGVLAIAGIVAAVAVTIPVHRSPPAAPTALDRFWAPALASPKPILIYNATSTVYQSPDLSDSRRHLVPVRGQYTCVGDAYASAVLSSLFTRKNKLYQIRYGSDLSFSDLRYQPSILIGAFNNIWTLQTTATLRFVFDKHPTILDQSENRSYSLRDLTPDGRTSEDYVIVSRVFDSDTGELLISAAGITQYGTRAAGEFLTSPNLMELLAARAPADWPKKNLQVLLHTRIVGDTSGPPSIIKTHFW